MVSVLMMSSFYSHLTGVRYIDADGLVGAGTKLVASWHSFSRLLRPFLRYYIERFYCCCTGDSDSLLVVDILAVLPVAFRLFL